jgi:SAM-dependent methyltransferase
MLIESRRGRHDERQALMPPELLPLFDDTFVKSCDLIEEYSTRLAARVFRSTGLEEACRQAVSVQQAVTRAGLIPEVATVPAAWVLAMLASRGWLSDSSDGLGEPTYRLQRPLPVLEPDEILEAQTQHDARCLPSYWIAALAAQHYPTVLRGQETGEQALFGPEGISTWAKYFSNGNPLYAISNAIGAIAAERALPAGAGAILEIGGGLGSAAEALLDRIAAAGRAGEVCAYQFTEISPLFLKRAQRTLSSRHPQCPFTFTQLDINGSLAAGGIPPEAFSLVYGVNVLHVARDLSASLGELRRALKPGGALVISECIRPFAGMPLHLELVFNLLPAFRDPVLVPGWRPNGGFLTPEQWSAALEVNGFGDVRVYPDIASMREAYPGLVVAAVAARRV